MGFSRFQTLPQEVLTKMHAPAKPDYPIVTAADLPQYDGFLIGYVSRRDPRARGPTPELRPQIGSALVMAPGQPSSRLSGILPDSSGRVVPSPGSSPVLSFRLLAQAVRHESGETCSI